MMALAARLIGGVFTPLIDQATASSARLLRKLALFVVAALALVVVLIALTVAFDLWIASMRGPIVGALAVAALYFVVAAVAVLVALRSGVPKAATPKAATERDAAAAAAKAGENAQIDQFAAPLLDALRRLGLRKEQLAVLAGTSVAKQLGPLPLVGLAIVGGFLVGRLWRGLFSTDAIASLLASDLLAGLFANKENADAPSDDEERDVAA